MAVQEIKRRIINSHDPFGSAKISKLLEFFKALSRHPLYPALLAQALRWLRAGLIASRLPQPQAQAQAAAVCRCCRGQLGKPEIREFLVAKLCSALWRVVVEHPLDAELIGEHAEVGAPESVL